MSFVLRYLQAIDKVMGDEALKLRRYELNNNDWVIIKDLIRILEVSFFLVLIVYITNTSQPADL